MGGFGWMDGWVDKTQDFDTKDSCSIPLSF